MQPGKLRDLGEQSLAVPVEDSTVGFAFHVCAVIVAMAADPSLAVPVLGRERAKPSIHSFGLSVLSCAWQSHGLILILETCHVDGNPAVAEVVAGSIVSELVGRPESAGGRG